jgi:hypothetical protein
MTRRAFLEGASGAALAWLAAHEALAAEAAPAPAPAAGAPLIRGLRLLTAAPLGAMRDFYRDRIGFAVLGQTPETITLAAGATSITFVAARPDQGKPFYHFAFNVPEDRLAAARAWQLERSPLVPPPRPGLTDPAFPPDVWHFRHWNAHSVFFFDPSLNIVEYIARHDLAERRGGTGAFGVADILYASEIGCLVTPQTRPPLVQQVQESVGLLPYPRGTSEAWAMGDERGLVLLLSRKGELWGENTATPVRWDVFPTEATLRGSRPGRVELEGFPYVLTLEKA